ncbi:hypothetical protein SAMN06272781_0035 [Streptomyces sp. 1222.2]|uniref:hypothetical protein n=1 Tax=Streptomyces sp. 1222.2 TaxID=1938833 RepID=UPI000BD1F162|nr:hypothetical protein [Streptomyces sp. 1222.2]SOD65187.1 hypothetical protein SAMN06272781_0035 [Streptomyces sp. 1222.2]
MTSVIARRLVVAAALVVLAATAACGGGGDDGPTPPGPIETEENGTPTSEETEVTSDEETDGEVFLGSDTEEASASDVELPPTQVGKPTQGEVDIKPSAQGLPSGLQNLRITIDGEKAKPVDPCMGEVPPDGCTLVFQYTPTRPGSYSGELTLTLDDGSTVTAAVYGEATEAPTSDTDSTTLEPATDEPTTDEPPTPFEEETPVPET